MSLRPTTIIKKTEAVFRAQEKRELSLLLDFKELYEVKLEYMRSDKELRYQMLRKLRGMTKNDVLMTFITTDMRSVENKKTLCNEDKVIKDEAWLDIVLANFEIGNGFFMGLPRSKEIHNFYAALIKTKNITQEIQSYHIGLVNSITSDIINDSGVASFKPHFHDIKIGGNYGLTIAMHKYNTDRSAEAKFNTYAYPWLIYYIKRELETIKNGFNYSKIGDDDYFNNLDELEAESEVRQTQQDIETLLESSLLSAEEREQIDKFLIEDGKVKDLDSFLLHKLRASVTPSRQSLQQMLKS
jgi:hypothetical protein